MSEATRRLKYARNRILIEASRILAPQFDDAIVYLSGAQIEMLRNVTHYLNRPSTFVAEYETGSYLMPTDADWDTIAGIVHDLEEVLMGNPNTIWGYSDTLSIVEVRPSASAGTNNLALDTVPAGKVWRITAFGFVDYTSVCTNIKCYCAIAPNTQLAAEKLVPVANVWDVYECDIILKEDDYVWVTFYGVTAGDSLAVQALGYVMDVPE